MTTSTYAVSGMTCAVEVDLDSGRVSVVSETPLAEGKVRDAVEEAGYQLVSAS